MANFDPCRIKTPELISIKFSTGDYIWKMTPYAKFGANPSTGDFCANK